ncbi:response regulator [Paenibacillus beijingensis]|uniref:AraC family transcriptional regulator n=1 Tax=Paenibacillus beijingensis TaxID=1126833 RepID=A0A0D5NLT3_9BACL|nr:response regulator [Paenibacillus beijingensis]AJY75893.1 hypothetical protein VN24_16720 [Paenibacillus beijingensis]
MYRVVIVDDEPIICNGIQAFIDWEKEGVAVEAVCTNSAAALTAMENLPVDILITDIQMPLMNGIELMKEAFVLYPRLKVIMISSYSDFEYVREGLKLGAVDYLLKSALEPAELLAVLRRCVSMLEEERSKEAEFLQYQHEAVYRERKYVEQEIKRLIVQEQVPYPPIDWAPSWLEQCYASVYFILDRVEELKETHGIQHVQLLLEDLQKLFYEQMDEGAAMLLTENSLFLLVPVSTGEVRSANKERDTAFQEPKVNITEWKRLAETKLGIGLSAGYTVMQGISGIPNGMARSRMACHQRFFEGLGRLFVWEETAERCRYPLFLAEKTKQYDWEPFFKIIRSGDPVSAAVGYALERWKGLFLTPEQIRQEAIDLLTETCERLSAAATLLPEWLERVKRAETLKQTASLMTDMLNKISNAAIPSLLDKGSGGEIITRALEYIADHYKENLTLQNVAGAVHVSKNYFSLLFKKQTGRNFIDYLIDLRIREAKRLLVEEDGRIYDVAETVGISDVKYFSKLFKKLTGLTPLEYREKYRGLESHKGILI